MKYSYVATFDEIAENDFNLNIPRYVDTFEEEAAVDIASVQTEIEVLEGELKSVQAEIQQEKLQFSPKVSVLPLGSRVVFSNLDRYDHHVRGLPAGLAGLNASPDSGFALMLPARVEGKHPASATETLNQAGPMQLGCHLHGSMRGSIYVTDNPWTVKTNDQGVAMVPNLPEGTAKVRVWHAEQLIEPAPTATSIKPLTVMEVPTRITPRRRRS